LKPNFRRKSLLLHREDSEEDYLLGRGVVVIPCPATRYPDLSTRIGVVHAVPKEKLSLHFDNDAITNYIDKETGAFGILVFGHPLQFLTQSKPQYPYNNN